MEQRPRASHALLVDDDEYVHGIVRRALAPLFVEVEGVVSGSAAVRAARTAIYDLVLLDLGLPDVDGWTVLRELQQIATLQDTPIVVVSGLIGHPAVRSAGVAAFIPKPIKTSVLIRVVRELLLTHRARPHGAHSA